MLLFLKALLPGIVGSILFWLMDRALLGVGGVGRIIGMIVALIVFTAVSLAVLRRRESLRRSISSDRRIGGDSEERFDDVTVRGGGDVELASRNKVKGKASVTVGRLEIE